MSRRRLRALGVAVIVAWSYACAATGASTDNGGDVDSSAGGDDLDASHHDGPTGPSPDAVQLGDGTHGGGDDASGGKSCQGLPDGTACGAAPDICHEAPVCSAGACAAPAPKADGFVCGAAPDNCHDASVCKSGSCAPQSKADGTACGSPPDACHEAPACSGGQCAAPANAPNGTVCAKAPDACHTDGTCNGGSCGAPGTRPEGYQWDPNDTYARCCGGSAIHTTTDNDCGVCGIVCNKNNSESCGLFNGHYYCLGCVASASCWSHCCSTSFGTPYRCAASDCTTGGCDSQYCPAGTHCVSGGGTTSNYCAY